MNIVQSYWTSPAASCATEHNNRFCGGWLSEKHHAIGWAFSFNLLRKYNRGKKINLFTDTQGAAWLVNRMGLVYDEVNTELDTMKAVHPLFWTAGKLFAYSKQETPFIHADGDVFAWQPVDELIQAKEIIVQNIEYDHPIYSDLLTDAQRRGIALPGCVQRTGSENRTTAVNAGVLGGSDIQLIKQYCDAAFRFFRQYELQILASPLSGSYNMLFEQFFFAQMILNKYGSFETTATITKPNEGQMHYLTRFGLVPRNCRYVHMIGPAKQIPALAHHMEQRFALEFPKAAQHIKSMYPEPPLYYLMQHLPDEYNGVCPDFSKEAPFFATRLQLQQVRPGITNTSTHFLEELLAAHFDEPGYFRLWDLYQVESASLSVQKLLRFDNHNYWTFSYDYDNDMFMNIPFRINTDVCRVIYLYHNWEGGLVKNNIRDFATGRLQLPLQPGNQLHPWLITQTYGHVQLQTLDSWRVIFHLLEEGPVTGEQILEKLKENDHLDFSERTIREDLVFFLSGQLFIHYRILPENSYVA